MNRDDRRKLEPGAGGPGRKAQADARQDGGKLRKNQERLHVGPDHKTDAMKKGRRGTYP
ncbi:MAG TPA: hypothetical protein VNU64_06285 [Burkholderiales bacterium]|jgi:hypothetical protein|nr:hypothetical protein [Burkholderiales bacterium]